ncbi:hypothetical protein [Micromonospora sp. B9E7]|uniref:hypothetical protein n=1 Tax=Micromonospora sp. B9E7 TaxID=3153574 RepID=UPI00325EE984
MTADSLHAVPVEVAARRPPLDYYLVRSRHDRSGSTDVAEGIVVEEFTRHRDFSTSGLNSAGWTPEAGWWSSASLSRGLRTDPELLARVVPVSRAEAEDVYRRLGGGRLPTEAALRTSFGEHQPIATAAPLRLGPAQAPAGFSERRVYRVLFAKDLRDDQVEGLRAAWYTTDSAPRPPGSAATGYLERGGDHFTWVLRRVGGGLAWCLDLTVLLTTDTSPEVGPILSGLTSALRQRGLIPVTTERFA